MSVLLLILLAAQMPLGGITAPTPAATCPVVPSPAPVSFWSLAGDTSGGSGCVPTVSSATVYDSGGGGNTGAFGGTFSGGVTGTAYSVATGRTATPYAMNFNASNNFVDNGLASNLPLSNTASSEFAWVYMNAVPSVAYVAWARGQNTSNHTRLLSVNKSGSIGVACFSGNGNDFCSTLTVSINAWHFVGFTYAAAATQVLVYVDGTSQTGSITALNTTSGTFYVGQFIDASSFRWNGLISDLGVWNSVLSSGQVSSIYAAQAFNVIPELIPLGRPYFSAEAITERRLFYAGKLVA